MTSSEAMLILSKPWLNVKDIGLILECGRDKASNIRDAIIEIIRKSGKTLPRGKYKIIPTKSFIEYLDLDIDFIFNMSNFEKNMKGV